MRLSRSLFGFEEHAQLPRTDVRVVAQQINTVVISTHFEVPVVWVEPPVEDLDDLQLTSFITEAARLLFTAITRVTLDVDSPITIGHSGFLSPLLVTADSVLESGAVFTNAVVGATVDEVANMFLVKKVVRKAQVDAADLIETLQLFGIQRDVQRTKVVLEL